MSSLRYGQTPLNNIGLDIDLNNLTDEFGRILDKFGVTVDHFHAFSDPLTGDIFINLTDNEGDLIDALITVDDDGIPGCLILDKKDMGVGWIDLEGIVPIVNNRLSFGNGSWFRYSILTNLLELGKVDFKKVQESESKEVVRTITRIEEAFTVKGSRKITVVSHRVRNRQLTTRQALGLASARKRALEDVAGITGSPSDEDRATKFERHISRFLNLGK